MPGAPYMIWWVTAQFPVNKWGLETETVKIKTGVKQTIIQSFNVI